MSLSIIQTTQPYQHQSGTVNLTLPRHNLGSWIEEQGDGLGSIAPSGEVKAALQACARFVLSKSWHKTPQVVVRKAPKPGLAKWLSG